MTRDELTDMIALAERLTAAGEHGVLATLFAADGSTYRPLGSMMVSGPPPIVAGGVSGGCLEQYVARQGRVLTQAAPAALLSFRTDPDIDDGKPILGCGGSIEVLVERLAADHLVFLKRLRDASGADHFSTAACIIETAAGKIVSVQRAWFDETPQAGPLARLQRRAVHDRHARHGVIGGFEDLAGKPRDGDAAPTMCADDAQGKLVRRALVHYIPPMTRLVVFGAGDDVQPLVTLAKSLGWHITVADRRARNATAERFPQADAIIAGEWRGSIDRIPFTPNTAIVLMTHSLPDDIQILAMLADKPFAYLGALGPAHRHGWLIDGASQIAVLGDEFTARVRGPIGLNLGDRSPAGIAVSVVSEILAEMNGRMPAPLGHAAAGVHLTVSSTNAMVFGA